MKICASWRGAWWVCGIIAALAGCASSSKQRVNKDAMDELSLLRREMAEVLIQKQDYDSAVPYLTLLLANYPQNARLHLLRGIVLRAKEAHQSAETELRTALRLDPENPETYAALGILKDVTGKHDEAEAHHREALKRSPNDTRFHNNLGFSLFLNKRYREAETCFLEAIRLDPGNRRAFNNLGFLYGVQEKDDAAMNAFSKAGSQPMVLTNMGMVEEMLGKPASARRYYEKALRLKSGYPPALKNLQAIDPQTYPPANDEEASPGGSSSRPKDKRPGGFSERGGDSSDTSEELDGGDAEDATRPKPAPPALPAASVKRDPPPEKVGHRSKSSTRKGPQPVQPTAP